MGLFLITRISGKNPDLGILPYKNEFIISWTIESCMIKKITTFTKESGFQ